MRNLDNKGPSASKCCEVRLTNQSHNYRGLSTSECLGDGRKIQLACLPVTVDPQVFVD